MHETQIYKFIDALYQEDDFKVLRWPMEASIARTGDRFSILRLESSIRSNAAILQPNKGHIFQAHKHNLKISTINLLSDLAVLKCTPDIFYLNKAMRIPDEAKDIHSTVTRQKTASLLMDIVSNVLPYTPVKFYVDGQIYQGY